MIMTAMGIIHGGKFVVYLFFLCIYLYRYVHLVPIRYPFLYSDQDVNCSGNEFDNDGGFCVRGNANDNADECNNNGDCNNGEYLVLSYVLVFVGFYM